jgi:hypothetical protein
MLRSGIAPLAGFVLAFAVGCEQPVAPPPFPDDAVAFEPPAIYSEWWALVEACTGRSGALAEISWYHAADPSGLLYGGREYGGLYFSDGHRILLDRQLMFDGSTVRHEMIHALAAPNGHPSALFHESCAHLQQCIGCERPESARGVPPGAPEFNALALDVSIVAQPDFISASASDRWYRLVVSAHNPRDEAVWIRLPDDVSFLFIEVGKYGSAALTDEPRWAFRPRETRSYTFDLRDSAGVYRFYGNFGGKRSDTITVTIAP